MSVHNFAEDNTLSSFAKTVSGGCAISWFRDNNMIVNPGKFQKIYLSLGKLTDNNYKLNLDIAVVNQVFYGTKSLRSFGTKIWNSLLHHVKFGSLSKNLLIAGMACLVTVLFVVWETFHKKFLDAYYSSAFCLLLYYIYLFSDKATPYYIK